MDFGSIYTKENRSPAPLSMTLFPFFLYFPPPPLCSTNTVAPKDSPPSTFSQDERILSPPEYWESSRRPSTSPRPAANSVRSVPDPKLFNLLSSVPTLSHTFSCVQNCLIGRSFFHSPLRLFFDALLIRTSPKNALPSYSSFSGTDPICPFFTTSPQSGGNYFFFPALKLSTSAASLRSASFFRTPSVYPTFLSPPFRKVRQINSFSPLIGLSCPYLP